MITMQPVPMYLPTVILVPARRGKFEQIDFVAAVDVLRNRPAATLPSA